MKGIFSSSLFYILLLVASIGISIVIIQNLISLNKGSQKQESLQNELRALRAENSQTQEILEHSKTDKALELEARHRLRLKKEGEEVVIIYPKEQERKPLTDEEFLRMYDQRYAYKKQAEKPIHTIPPSNILHSILSHILPGKEEAL